MTNKTEPFRDEFETRKNKMKTKGPSLAQALARIEELKTRPMTYYETVEFKRLLLDHADSIVQLGKVAQSMALDLKMVANWSAEDEGEPIHMHRYYSEQAYHNLMNGEEVGE